MTTLAELKRCPKCKSADLTFPWQRGTLPDCWHCHSCLENFDTPITLAPIHSPANPESAYGRSRSMDKRLEAQGKPPESAGPLRELIAKWRDLAETGVFYEQEAIRVYGFESKQARHHKTLHKSLTKASDELEALLPAIESAIQQAVTGALMQKFANVKKVILDLSWIPLNMRHDVIRNLEIYTSVPADAQAALDALIETAIDRCAKEIDKQQTTSESDYYGYNDIVREMRDIVRAITPASVREESHRAK